MLTSAGGLDTGWRINQIFGAATVSIRGATWPSLIRNFLQMLIDFLPARRHASDASASISYVSVSVCLSHAAIVSLLK